MEAEQKAIYIEALAAAIALVVGPRDEDYNKGGIGLRDYWKVNGINAPIQMVDMKLKRALSQLGTWGKDERGRLVPRDRAAVEKLSESMLDLINYAAFVICEAESLLLEQDRMAHLVDVSNYQPMTLSRRIAEGIHLWQHQNKKAV